MRTLELDLLGTLALATALYFLGQLIVRRSAFLQPYSIPVPVVGGLLFALVGLLGASISLVGGHGAAAARLRRCWLPQPSACP